MIKLDGVQVIMAMDRGTVIANIARNSEKALAGIHDLPEWRGMSPIAIVGGGPSLNDVFDELLDFENVMACGSVHDHLVSRGVDPRWTIVSDPDPIAAAYLKNPVQGCTYLVASMCDEAVFEALRGQQVVLWHCGDQEQAEDLWGPGEKILIGGGCTVGTRGFAIALAFGYSNIHLFGFDTCLRSNEHHAYGFATSEEDVGEVMDVSLFSENGPKYRVAGYHLGQLFDFKRLLREFGSKLDITVHGGGLIAEMLMSAGGNRAGDENG